MRSVFAKEFRQNHLLVWVGFLLSAAIAVLYWAWTRNYVKTIQDERDLNAFCGIIVLLTTGVVVLVSTAGLFSIETTRGTLPFLLGLPVSRARIWLAKGLAGLAIAISSALLLIVPTSLVLPQIVKEIHFLLYLPDIVTGVLFLFSVTLFCSTVFQRVISVLLVTVIMLAVVLIGEALFLNSVAPILGYDDLFDFTLLSLFLVPAFLLASLFTFSRGELLMTRRKWGLAVFSLLVGILVVGFALYGVRSWMYRYQRSGVKALEAISLHGPFARSAVGGEPVLSLAVAGSPAPFQRDTDHGWVRGGGPYRSRHLVVIDLKTGREALVLPLRKNPGEREADASPDGRFYAQISQGVFGERRLSIWDLRSRRLVHGGMPKRLYGGEIYGLDWSPKGDFLALNVHYRRPARANGRGVMVDGESIYVMRPNGDVVKQIPLWEATPEREPDVYSYFVRWTWAPDGISLYTMRLDGHILRHRVSDGEAQKVWQPPVPDVSLPKGYFWWFNQLIVSPDGRWLVIRGVARTRPQTESSKNLSVTLVISSDGSRAVLISRDIATDLVWSGDRLFLTLFSRSSLSVHRWQPGEDRAVPVATLPLNPAIQKIASLEDGSLLIWGQKQAYLVDQRGKLAPLADPRMRNLPHDYWFLGLDSEGRVIAKNLRGTEIAAIDIKTGQLTKLYP